MWNIEMYKAVLKAIKGKGVYKNKTVRTLEELYGYIADDLDISVDTVKSWSRYKSNGPKAKYLNKLAEILECPKEKLCCKENIVDTELLLAIQYKNANQKKNKLNDFSKTYIMKAYSTLKNYLESDDVEKIEEYDKVFDEIQTYRIAIPDTIFNKISDFMDEYIAPISYEHDFIFADCYTEDIGFYNEENIFQTKDERATIEMCVRYATIMQEIKQAFEQFADNELKPYLII